MTQHFDRSIKSSRPGVQIAGIDQFSVSSDSQVTVREHPTMADADLVTQKTVVATEPSELVMRETALVPSAQKEQEILSPDSDGNGDKVIGSKVQTENSVTEIAADEYHSTDHAGVAGVTQGYVRPLSNTDTLHAAAPDYASTTQVVGGGMMKGGVGVQPSRAAKKSIDESNLSDLIEQLNRGGEKWTDSTWENGAQVVTITYALPQTPWDLPYITTQYQYNFFLDGDNNLNFVPFDSLRADAVELATARWADVTNIRFEEVEAGSKADIYFYGQSLAEGAAFSTGVDEPIGSRIVFNVDHGRWEDQAMQLGGGGIDTLMHEIGHSIGLNHPGDYNVGDGSTYETSAEYIQDTHMYSIMSYWSGERTGFDGGTFGEILDTPRTHDMYVVQSMYGVNWDTRDGHTIYGFNASGVSGTFDFDINTAPILTIWDGGGVDWLDLSGDANDVRIDLNPGAFSSTHGMTNNISVAYVPTGAPAGHDAYIENALGGTGNDTIIGNSRNNLLIGNDGRDALKGEAGNDTLYGGRGNDWLYGGKGSDTLRGGHDNDTLNGEEGDDYLYGEAGNDRLIGNLGDDTFYGGSGTDTVDYRYSQGDWIIELAGIHDDTSGIDIRGTAKGSSTVEDLYDIENVDMGSGNDRVTGSSRDNRLKGGDGDDTLLGLAGLDRLDGGSGNDTLFGGDGEDTLIGSFGDDTLSGGLGSDHIHGGPGIDTVDYTYSASDVRWYIDLENGTANSSESNDLLFDIESAKMGDGRDTIYGSSANNTIEGGGGNDRLFGYDGADFLFGGDDHDMLDGGQGNDVMLGGAGVDTASYENEMSGVRVDLAVVAPQDTVGAGLDVLVDIENLEGSDHNDWLSGDAAGNRLYGGLGHDQIFGRAGIDWLFGEGGDDVLYGGPDDDLLYGGSGVDMASYLFSSAGVRVNLDTTGFQNTLGDGTDLLHGIENLGGSLHNDSLLGDEGGNRLVGLAGNDLLLGQAGNDVLLGGIGNDSLNGGQGNDVLEGGDGNDWALYNAGVTAGVVVNANADSQNTYGAGIDSLRDIENILGSHYGDALGGDDGANELRGGGGDDWLFGRRGNDVLKGENGNDFIFGDAGHDVIIGGYGNDSMNGGHGNDDFLFDDNWGNDTIVGYQVGRDEIDLRNVTGIDNLIQLDIADTADGAVVAHGNNTILISGVSAAQLSDDDFLI